MFSRIAAVAQHGLHCIEVVGTACERQKTPLALSDVGAGNGDGMGQAQSIHRKVTFDARHFLACIISLFLGRVRVLHTLSVEEQESGGTFSLGASANCAHQIVLEHFRVVFLLLSPLRWNTFTASLKSLHFPLRWKVILKREALKAFQCASTVKAVMENTGKAAGDASLRSA